MDTTLVTITGAVISATLAAIASSLVTKAFDRGIWYTRSVREKTLKGHWEGDVQQGNGEQGTLSCHIDKVGRTLRGAAHIRYQVQNQEITEDLEAYGGFIHERFLKLEYKNKHKPELIQFGFAILKLEDDGQTLDGHFVGFGPRVRAVVWGSIQLHKKM